MTRSDLPTETESESFAPLAWVLLGALVAVVVAWVLRRSTWYLSIDQFGYLTFAEDLAQGRLAHSWAFFDVLDRYLPAGAAVDVLGQSYVYEEGRAYSRYAPGFPLLLALVRWAFGPEAVHLVNPIFSGALLLTVFALGRQAFRSVWWGLVGALLVTLLPTYVLLWSLSPLRDVPAHTAALAALALLFPAGRAGRRRAAVPLAAGVLLGVATTIRVDALLYAIPAAGLAWLGRPWRRSELLGLGAGLALGLLPLLAFNAIATGNPFWPTQAMELDDVLSLAPPASEMRGGAGLPDGRGAETSGAFAWAGLGVASAHAQSERVLDGSGGRDGGPRLRGVPHRPDGVQGGGLRLSHLAGTLPENLAAYAAGFGVLGMLLALLGAAGALRRNIALFVGTVPYVVTSLLFFSLWTRADPRYLLGAILLTTLLVTNGAAASFRFLTRQAEHRGGGRWAAAAAGVAVAVVAGLTVDVHENSARPWVLAVLGGTLFLSAPATVAWPAARRASWGMVVAVALSLVVGWRTVGGLAVRGSFQAAQVEAAREAFARHVDEPAVIITSAAIGRPAENINYYTSASAVYLEELLRWRLRPRRVLDLNAEAGLSTYLLLPPGDARRWTHSAFLYPWFEPQLVVDIPAEEARGWFVASAGHEGVPLWLVRMQPRPARVPMPRLPTLTRRGGSEGSR